MDKLVVKHDENTCIACGVCVSVCPEKWKFIDVNGELKVINHDKDFIPIDSDISVKAKDAEKSCPVNAIKIDDVK